MRFIIPGLILILSGCGSVPVQLKDAMDVQGQEIENVKSQYRTNIYNLLDAVEAHQMEILRLHEENVIARYSKALDEVNGNVQEVEPTGDPDVDHIHLSTLNKIHVFFEQERQKVRRDIRSRREEYAKIEHNFANIESINQAVADYIASLRRLKNARSQAARVLVQRATGFTSLPVSLSNVPDPATIEDLVNNFSPQG